MPTQRTVLVVEDNEADVSILQAAFADLENPAIQATAVPRLSDAIARVARSPVDLVMLDLGLPDSSGLDTFYTFHARAPEVPALVLTALDDERQGIEAVRAGAQDYLLKKYIDPSWLGRVIEYAIERHRITEDLVRSREDLRLLAGRLEAVREDERKRISREIHDGLGQMLTGCKMDLRWVTRHLERSPDAPDVSALLEKLESADAEVDSAIGTVQRIALELRPSVLDNLGLGDAIRDEVRRFESRAGVTCELDLHEDVRVLDGATSTALFRILQELLTNVARHASATRVTVRLCRQGADVVLEVSDDGLGIRSGTKRPDALGLLGIRERASNLGGRMEIGAASPRGTRATVSIPSRPAA